MTEQWCDTVLLHCACFLHTCVVWVPAVSQVMELENKNDKIIDFAWEPHGHRFAIIHGDGPKPDVSIFSMKATTPPPLVAGKGDAAAAATAAATSSGVQKVVKLTTLKARQANSLHWSPAGRFLLIAGLKGFNGQLEFFNVDDLETTATAEHFTCTDIEWDPTGRYRLYTPVLYPIPRCFYSTVWCCILLYCVPWYCIVLHCTALLHCWSLSWYAFHPCVSGTPSSACAHAFSRSARYVASSVHQTSVHHLNFWRLSWYAFHPCMPLLVCMLVLSRALLMPGTWRPRLPRYTRRRTGSTCGRSSGSFSTRSPTRGSIR